MEKFDDIKVGDKVVVVNRYRKEIATVDKVTPKRFKIGNTTYSKSDGYEYGAKWSYSWCQHVTDELCEEIARNEQFEKMRRKLSNIRLGSYNYEMTKLLYDFMVEHSLIVED